MVLRSAFWGVVSVSAVALIGYVFTRSATLTRIFYLGLLLILISLIWTVFSLNGLQLERGVRGFKQQLGQVLEERFIITNRSRTGRLWVEVQDGSDLPQANASRVISGLRSGEVRSFSAYTLLTRRGLFHLGPTTISSGDPLGLFEKRIVFPTKQTLLVMPYMVKLNRFPFPPGYLSGGKVLWRKTHEVTPHAAGIREYAPGDALSRIHWPMTARKDRFMVKEFDQDPQADVWILLDGEESTRANIHLPGAPKRQDRLWVLGQKFQVSLPPDSFEYSVSAAASIADYFLTRGESVGLVCAGQMTVTLPAEKGERQLGKLLETLAFIKPEGEMPLHGLVDIAMQHFARGSTAILITTTRSETVVVSVERLLRKNIHPIVVMMESSSFGGSEGEGDELLKRLGEYPIPILMVQNGTDLKQALEGLS